MSVNVYLYLRPIVVTLYLLLLYTCSCLLMYICICFQLLLRVLWCMCVPLIFVRKLCVPVVRCKFSLEVYEILNTDLPGHLLGIHSIPPSSATEMFSSFQAPDKYSKKFVTVAHWYDRLCGLVVRVLYYRSTGPGFDSRALPKKSSGSGTGSTQPREYNWGATW
jgi:hypothetical protein